MHPLRAILAANATLRARAGQHASPVARSTWDRVVGPRIAARSEPDRLERGILLVRVASSAWANELSLLSEPIVEQLRAQGIDVTAVRFVVGDVALSPRRTRGPAAVVPPRDAPIPAALVAVLERVPSAALRDALAEAAAKSMALAEAAAQRFGKRRAPSAGNEPPPRARVGALPEPTKPARWVDRARESLLPPPPEGAAGTARAEQERAPGDDGAPDSVEGADEPQQSQQ
jgi:hypothetical protein